MRAEMIEVAIWRGERSGMGSCCFEEWNISGRVAVLRTRSTPRIFIQSLCSPNQNIYSDWRLWRTPLRLRQICIACGLSFSKDGSFAPVDNVVGCEIFL